MASILRGRGKRTINRLERKEEGDTTAQPKKHKKSRKKREFEATRAKRAKPEFEWRNLTIGAGKWRARCSHDN